MDQCRPCGCKGRRSCLICEEEYQIEPPKFDFHLKENGYVYCHVCQKAWPGWDFDPSVVCPNHDGECISVNGIYVQPNFISEEEKQKLLNGMNKDNWEASQSGRRKQNYGPKCNFKKNKLQIGNFGGFPSYSRFIQDKFKDHPILMNYNVIEQCSLEYDPKRGASIDPHIDDCWIWGERIVTVNVLGNTFLTLSRFKGDKTKYNLNQVSTYPCVLDRNGCILDNNISEPFCMADDISNSDNFNTLIRVFMPEKSLIILYGSARYEWEHFVLREDIKSLRICLAFREFTPPYLPGGNKENLSIDILNMSRLFW